MQIQTTDAAIACAIIAHAFIARIQGPSTIVNVVSWVMTIILVLIVVFGGFAIR